LTRLFQRTKFRTDLSRLDATTRHEAQLASMPLSVVFGVLIRCHDRRASEISWSTSCTRHRWGDPMANAFLRRARPPRIDARES